MRCFIALDIPNNVKDEIYSLYKEIKFVRGKFVEKENLHITLKFLGEIQPNFLKEILKKLEEIKYPKFFLKLKGIGFFPNEKNPRVLWIGIGVGKENIIELQKIIDNKLLELKIPREINYVPHLTILRIKEIYNRKNFFDSIEKLKEYCSEKIEITKFSLKQSILTPQGPIYRDIKVFELE